MRDHVRRAVAHVRLAGLRLSGRRAGVALMYHRIAPSAGDPRREFVPALAAEQFDRQLAHLRRHYRPVGAEDLQAAAAARRRGQRFPVAITFDDDTLSHLEYAAPCLRRHRVPATFFLNGHALDAPSAYWWEILQAAAEAGTSWAELVPPGVFRRAQEVERGAVGPYGLSVAIEELPTADRRALAAQVAETLGDAVPAGGLRADQVRQLARAGFTIGFHGHRHEPMSLLEPRELARELDGGRDRLADVAGTALTTIAYPHGRANADVAAASRGRGFTCGFTVRAAAVTPDDDALLLGRVDGNTQDLAAFRGAVVHALAQVA